MSSTGWFKVRLLLVAVGIAGILLVGDVASAELTQQAQGDNTTDWPEWGTVLLSGALGLGSGFGGGFYSAKKQSKTEVAKLLIAREEKIFDEALETVRDFSQAVIRALLSPPDSSDRAEALARLYGLGLELQRRCEVTGDPEVLTHGKALREVATSLLSAGSDSNRAVSLPAFLPSFESKVNSLIKNLTRIREGRLATAARAA